MQFSYDQFKILDTYVEEVIKPYFNIEFPGGHSISNEDHLNYFTGDIRFPASIVSYKNTDYYYKGDNKKFIHFTSLNAFFQIINNGYFIASQFTNHDDPLELLYAGDKMLSVISKEKLTHLKELLFSLSMCIF